jgi:hypothetical protein
MSKKEDFTGRLWPLISAADYLELINTAQVWGSADVPPHRPWEEYLGEERPDEQT